ncbi:MAG: hypothetical protein WAM28_08075 [Chlamydiales bacterium]
MKKFFLTFAAVCVVIFQSIAYSYDSNYSGSGHEGRIALSADNIIVSDSGIYILLPSSENSLKKIAVSQLNSDEHGLYIFESNISSEDTRFVMRCPNFHPCVCPRCFGCGAGNCPYRCRCNE